MPELQVLNGSLQWKTIPVAGARFLIGRKDSCHLILRDGWVSREHTLIMEPKPGEFRVQDLDSENGTFLNGERIRDTAMKHGDLLRVGRTEMRFIQHAGMPVPGDAHESEFSPDDAEGGLRTEGASTARDGESPATFKNDPMSRTTADEGPKSNRPRIDLRERVRMLEERLLEHEQANAALAAENAVLKRALARLGMIDKTTGAVDPGKLTPPPAALVPEPMLRLVTNPLARIAFPGLPPAPGAASAGSAPGLLRLGVAGIDAVGIRFAEAVSRLGYRNAVAITAERDAMRGGAIDPAWRVFVDKPRGGRPPGADTVFIPAMPKIEEVFGEAFSKCDRVLLCADASAPLCTESLTQLGDAVRRAGSQPGAVVFFDPADDHVESHARAETSFASARPLVESGRLAPFIVVDLSRASQLDAREAAGDPATPRYDALAGVLDALLRLPAMPSLGPPLDTATIGAVLLARGWSTIGLGATRATDRAALEAAFAAALGPSRMARAMPASRARTAAVFTVVGSGPPQAADLEAARGSVAKLLPQAQRIEATWHDGGESTRIFAFIGGLPFPETFFNHGTN
jgi:hypothetical protein